MKSQILHNDVIFLVRLLGMKSLGSERVQDPTVLQDSPGFEWPIPMECMAPVPIQGSHNNVPLSNVQSFLINLHLNLGHYQIQYDNQVTQ